MQLHETILGNILRKLGIIQHAEEEAGERAIIGLKERLKRCRWCCHPLGRRGDTWESGSAPGGVNVPQWLLFAHRLLFCEDAKIGVFVRVRAVRSEEHTSE